MDILRNEGYFRKKYYQDTKKKKNKKKKIKKEVTWISQGTRGRY